MLKAGLISTLDYIFSEETPWRKHISYQRQAHADLKGTSENRLFILNLEIPIQSQKIAPSRELIIRTSTWSVKTLIQILTVQVRILTLDLIPVHNLPSHSAAFLQKSLKDLSFIPLQGNFQTSKIFTEWQNTFSPIPGDDERVKT